MQKFENVDLIDTLYKIMQANTKYYQSDFEYDKKAITAAAQSKQAEDKNMVWLSRLHGTHCYYEKDVYIKNTGANTTWKHWSEHKNETPLAYAIEITHSKQDKIYGNLYQLDYAKSVETVKKNEIKADDQILHYEHGDEIMDFGKWFSAGDHKDYGKYIGLDYIPNDKEKLKTILKKVRAERQKYPVGNIETHLCKLDREQNFSIKMQLADSKSKGDNIPTKKSKTKQNEMEV